MCILFFAIKQHPKYPVIICANRDEFHQRPTNSMHWWSDSKQYPNILAGKDMQAGGTWLGINKSGRFSALTNFRQPESQDDTKKSRGELVLQALTSNDKQTAEQLKKSTLDYNGYNLVFGQLNNLSCFDNISQKLQPLSSGFHALCNGALDDIWPKMALGQHQLTEVITSTSLDVSRLFSIMNNNEQANIQHLPNTGLPLDWEKLLSSIFIVSPEYGTRTTNIILQDNDGNITVYDRSYNEKGQCVAEQNFSFP